MYKKILKKFLDAFKPISLFEINDIFIRITDDPFKEVEKVKILDVKKNDFGVEYVQFVYTQSSKNLFKKESTTLEHFLICYKKEK